MVRNRIKVYRQLCGKNQIEMSEVLGVSESQYRQKENGNFEFKESEILKFLNEVNKYVPNATVEDIFFAKQSTKKDEKSVT